MKPIDVVIHTTPADYTRAAALFKQLGLLLSAKLQSQIRLIGIHHDTARTRPLAGGLVQVNGRTVAPEAGRIVDEIRRQLHPCACRAHEPAKAA